MMHDDAMFYGSYAVKSGLMLHIFLGSVRQFGIYPLNELIKECLACNNYYKNYHHLRLP